MKNIVILNLEKQIFRGNLLDVGLDNHGTMFNLYKENNDNFDIDYINENRQAKNPEKNYYDNSTIFFSLHKIKTKKEKEALLDYLFLSIKVGGLLYIWDIDKKPGRIFFKQIKVFLPKGKVDTISIMNLNIFSDCSKTTLLKLLRNKFDIIDIVSSDLLYHIVAKKKERSKNEGNISGNKFKIHS